MKIAAWIGSVARIGGALACLALLVAWSGGCFDRRVEPGKVDAVGGARIEPGARTVPVERTTVAPRVDVVGTVVSEENIHLSARISAYVSGVRVTAGDAVTKDQVVVTLDDRELMEQLAAAQAQLRQAETEYERTRKLVEARAATEQALTAATAAFDSARAQVKRVEVMLTYTVIRSPIDGRAIERRIETGDLASPGQVLLTVYDPTRMRLEAPVPVRLLARARLGQGVMLNLDPQGLSITGTVSEIVAEVDPMSRTQLVKVRLPVLEGGVLPGTFGRLWLDDDARAALLVPGSAVRNVGQLQTVLVPKGDRVSRRLVRTGMWFGDRIEILAGLDAGEAVLTPDAGVHH